MTQATPAGWFPDPQERGDYRYWDGSVWTSWISRSGSVEQDPVIGGSTQTGTPVAAPASDRPRVGAAQVRAALGGALVMLGVVLPGFSLRFNSFSWRDVEAGEFPLWAVALILGGAIIVFAYRRRYGVVRLLAVGSLATLALALWLYQSRLGEVLFEPWPSPIDIVWGDTRVTFGVYAIVIGAILALIAGRTSADDAATAV